MNTQLLSLLIFLTTALPGQTPASPKPSSASTDDPVGRWVAVHPKADDLELWWDFRAGGRVTATAGAIVHSNYKLDGNTLTVLPNRASPGGSFDIYFRDGKLFSTANADRSPTLEYTRIGEPTSSESALVGVWRISNAPHATDPQEEALRNRMVNMITVYRADGTYEVRMPIQTFEGSWNAASHTYTLNEHPPLHFSRSSSGLTLALPPDGKETHLYHPDVFPRP